MNLTINEKRKNKDYKSYIGNEDRITEYNPREIPISYDLLQFLKQRRSQR